MSGLAQQFAYNLLFAVAPLLMFLTAFSGLVVRQVNSDIQNPVQPILDWLDANLPADAAQFLRDPVESALTVDPTFLLSFGGLLTLWAAKNAMTSVMKGLNATYGLEDTRPFIKKQVIAMALTVGLASAILISGILLLLSTGPGEDIADAIRLGSSWRKLVDISQWPLTALTVTLVIVVIHRFAPNFDAPFRWYLPGALFTTIGLAVATWGLQFYFAHFGGFSAAYGIFGAVLTFIFWLFVVGVVLLAGGVINAAMFEEVPQAAAALKSFRKDHKETETEEDPTTRAGKLKAMVWD